MNIYLTDTNPWALIRWLGGDKCLERFVQMSLSNSPLGHLPLGGSVCYRRSVRLQNALGWGLKDIF